MLRMNLVSLFPSLARILVNPLSSTIASGPWLVVALLGGFAILAIVKRALDIVSNIYKLNKRCIYVSGVEHQIWKLLGTDAVAKICTASQRAFRRSIHGTKIGMKHEGSRTLFTMPIPLRWKI